MAKEITIIRWQSNCGDVFDTQEEADREDAYVGLKKLLDRSGLLPCIDTAAVARTILDVYNLDIRF